MKDKANMNVKTARPSSGSSQSKASPQQAKRSRKLTEYGRQLAEKQKVKKMYGLRERQFRCVYANASKSPAATGIMLLSLLERRLDNVMFRLKFSTTRRQARQVIVHGHVLVNDSKVSSPSYIVNPGDKISFAPQVSQKTVFVDMIVDKRTGAGSKVPEWLELDKENRVGRVLRDPARSDIQAPIEEYLIVELYSK